MTIPPRRLRLAAAAYPIEALGGWPALAGKLAAWCAEAAENGADLLVFPEYAGLEAALAGAGRANATAAEWGRRSAAAALRYRQLMADLAMKYRVHVLTGSLPADAQGRLVNRAWWIAPDGEARSCDKRVLTPWERRETDLAPGEPPRPIATPFGRVGVLICYDSEFPLLARALAPDLVLIPACTDLRAGHARVRLAARARALEAQAVAVHAPLLGAIPHCPYVDANTGAAGIYGPPDHGMSDDGIIATGPMDRPGWTYADLAAGALSDCRGRAAVDIPGHWSESESGAGMQRSRDPGTEAP